MSVLTDRRPDSLPGGDRFWTTLTVTGICVGAFLAGLVAILVTHPLAQAIGVATTDAFEVVGGHLIQVGFAAFGIGYLLVRGDYERFVRVRRPTLEDVGWILGLPVAFVVLGTMLQPVLTAIGLIPPTPTGVDEGIDLASRPDLWPIAFVGLFVFAAPAEELVYRGIVQGRLRETFDTPGVLLGSALSFGLLHLLIGLVTSGVGTAGTLYWGIETFAGGLVWAYAYERTENLTVTAVNHATMWVLPLHAILEFL